MKINIESLNNLGQNDHLYMLANDFIKFYESRKIHRSWKAVRKTPNKSYCDPSPGLNFLYRKGYDDKLKSDTTLIDLLAA